MPDWLRILAKDCVSAEDWKDPGRAIIGSMNEMELNDLRRDLKAGITERPASEFLGQWESAFADAAWDFLNGVRHSSLVRVCHEIDRRNRPDSKPDLHRMVEEKKESSKGLEIEQFAAITGIRVNWPRQRLVKCVLPGHKDGTPSLMVKPGGGFYCFGCKKGGSMIDFVKEYRCCSLRHAMEEYLTLP